MNSLVTLELNSLLRDYVRDNPITGKPQTDERIVGLVVTFLSTYLVVCITGVQNKIKGIYNWFMFRYFYKSSFRLDLKENKKIVHIQNLDTGTMYNAYNRFIKSLPRAENDNFSIDENEKNKLSFKYTGDGTENPWRFGSNAYLPIEEDLKKNKNPQNQNLKESYSVIFEEREINVAVFYHSNNGGYNYYHLFIEKKEKETIEDIKQIVSEFNRKALNYYNGIKESKKYAEVTLYEISNGQWKESQVLSEKSVESIVGNNCRNIYQDVIKFKDELGDLYRQLDIPYKRGYLLYGPPGTGKTSVVRAIASVTKKNIYMVSFNETGLGDEDYTRLLKSTKSDDIILMDDIDPRLLKEGGFIEKTVSKNIEVAEKEDSEGDTVAVKKDKNGGKEVVKNQMVRVSYGTLLNILDGINSNTGRINFITTNHPDKMGKAILRPGRLDVKVKMGYASDEEIIEYFQLFYKYFKLEPNLIEENAKKFNKKFGKKEKNITFAMLQQYLIQYMDDIEKAVENALTIFKSEDMESFV